MRGLSSVARCRSLRPTAARGLPARAVLTRAVHGLDADEDEVDASEELLTVVVFAQLRSGFAQGWVPGGVELRPPLGDRGEEG